MKAILDENLPVVLARALNAFEPVTGIKVFHSTDFAVAGASDLELFSKLVESGVLVHVTQDQHHRKPIERRAIADAGLIVFVLQRNWSSQPFWMKAPQMIRWWPLIVAHAERMTPPAMFRVPWNLSGKGKFEQIPMR